MALVLIFTLIPAYALADDSSQSTDFDWGSIIGSLDTAQIVELLKGLIGDNETIANILSKLDVEQIVAVLNGLVDGDVDISGILGSLDKDQLIELAKQLIGDNETIAGILESLDTEQLVALIQALVGGDVDISGILESLDKDQLIELAKQLIGDNETIAGILESLDAEQLVALIQGLISGDIDFSGIVENLDFDQLLALLAGLFAGDIEVEGPSDVTVTETQDATFSVKVKLSLTEQLEGLTYSYIWVEPDAIENIDFGNDGGSLDVVGVIAAIASKALSTSDTLVIKDTVMRDNGRSFVCVIYNLSEKVIYVTDPATLTVTPMSDCSHSVLLYHPAVEYNCTKDGNIAYYECTLCHKLFLDAEHNVQTNESEVFVIATGHNFEGIQCTKCGEYIPFPFIDVPENMWCRAEVEYVWKHSLMQGVTSMTFEPDTVMTRAMFVTVLYRMAGSPSVESMTEPFTDVDENYWAYDAIVWGYNKGVIKGFTATTFEPKSVITRAQIVTMLYRYEGEPDVIGTLEFADSASIAAPYRDAVLWASENGIVSGYANGTFRPNNTATRGHMAAIIARYCESYKGIA